MRQEAKLQARFSELHKRIDSLTDREREVMKRVVAGDPNKVIANNMAISMRTVARLRSAHIQETQLQLGHRSHKNCDRLRHYRPRRDPSDRLLSRQFTRCNTLIEWNIPHLSS